MADRKYVRILAKDLPDVFYTPSSGNAYFVRYRVASEDGRLTSRWSQKFEVQTNIVREDIDITEINNGALWDHSVNNGVLTLTWDVKDLFDNKKLFVNKFHIYVKFKDNLGVGTWQFFEESSKTSTTILIPSTAHKTDVLVILPTYRGLDATITSVTDPVSQFPESIILFAEDLI